MDGLVLEKTLESLDCKEIQPVHPKRDQSWVFIGRTDAEAETPILWPPHAKNWLIGKDPDAGKDWGQEEKGAMEDDMVGWHHWLSGHEFEQTSSVGKESTGNAGDPGLIPGSRRSAGEGIGYPLQYSGLENSMDYTPWGRKESDTTEQCSLFFFWEMAKDREAWHAAVHGIAELDAT